MKDFGVEDVINGGGGIEGDGGGAMGGGKAFGSMIDGVVHGE